MNKLTTLLSKVSLAKVEKYITLFIYYILPVIVIITLISAMLTTSNVWFSRQEFRGNRWWNLLIIVLFIKPITFLGKKYFKAESITLEYFIQILKDLPKTIKNNQKNFDSQMIHSHIIPFIVNSFYSISLYLMRFRRPLGIATFWLLFTHGLLWQTFRIRQGFSFGFNIGETAILSGMITLLALVIGAITSNDYAMQKLQKNRKKVQMIAYIAFFFAAIHTGNIFWLIVYFVAKYFERRDTGMLKERKIWIIHQANTIKNNKRIQKQRNAIKNNKSITKIMDKIHWFASKFLK